MDNRLKENAFYRDDLKLFEHSIQMNAGSVDNFNMKIGDKIIFIESNLS